MAFVPGRIVNVDVKFLLDTGSSVSIIHPHTFELLPLSCRHTVTPSDKTIIAAEGTKMQVQGTLQVVIKLGALVKRHTVYIAPITQAGILGLDFLTLHQGVLDLHRKRLMFEGAVKSRSYLRISRQLVVVECF